MSTAATTTSACPKCDGRGKIAGYAHVRDGVCFGCGGSGTIVVRPPSAAAERKRAAQQARTERWVEFQTAYPTEAHAWGWHCGRTAALVAAHRAFLAGDLAAVDFAAIVRDAVAAAA